MDDLRERQWRELLAIQQDQVDALHEQLELRRRLVPASSSVMEHPASDG